MSETVDAIIDHTLKVIDPLGQHHEVEGTLRGELYTTSRIFNTGRIVIPGIGTGVAYTSLDAFGTRMTIPVPIQGTIASFIYLDLDDEGLNKDFVFFNAEFTATADNAAFNVSDEDLLKCVGGVTVSTFMDFTSNQVGIATPALYYEAPLGFLWCQVVTRGADNIAAANIPQFYFLVV